MTTNAYQSFRQQSFQRRLYTFAMALMASGIAFAQSGSESRTNYFNDPFVRATSAIKACPVPEGPLVTAAEARAQAHVRAERGTTCHYYGRCRLPNAYLYDQDIVSRVARFIQLDDRFKESSIWLLGQRRWVYLQGCIGSRALADELVREVKLIDDVEHVLDQLMIPGSGVLPYPTAPAGAVAR